MFTLCRWLITAIYAAAMVSSFAWVIHPSLGPVSATLMIAPDNTALTAPLTAAALTATYGILMLLLWLHDRYPKSA
jgi:hypothetical protein